MPDVLPFAHLNLARVIGGRSRKPSKTANVPPHDSSTETAKPSFGKREIFLFDAANFTDRSGPFAGSAGDLQFEHEALDVLSLHRSRDYWK
jgi:hypothetical protein